MQSKKNVKNAKSYAQDISIRSYPKTPFGRLILKAYIYIFKIFSVVHLGGAINPIVRNLSRFSLTSDSIDIVFRDLVFRVPLNDPYWINAALERSYEKDVMEFLEKMPKKTTLFLDCGANIGWYSTIAASLFGWETIAVEAAPNLLGRLRENIMRNGLSVSVINKAIWRKSGECLNFYGSDQSHAGGHVYNEEFTSFIKESRLELHNLITSVTIDELTEDFRHSSPNGRIIIKLDVEGAERAAFQGANETLQFGAIFIYEDHGSDIKCEASEAAIEAGCELYNLDSKLNLSYSSLKEIKSVKRNSRIGYNFVAVSGHLNKSYLHSLY